MFDFSNVSNEDLVDAFKLIKQMTPGSYEGLARAVAVELDARLHAIVPGYSWVVQL